MSLLSSRRVIIFTGALGSGKTEVAINYARAMKACAGRVYLADLDVITPYFRVGDCRDKLAQEGITVIAAPGELASFELPALTPEIMGALRDPAAHVILDVGGDPAGARLLGVYADQIATLDYDLWMVANPFRPETNDAAAIVSQARAIEEQSRLHLTGLIANPNLGLETQVADVARGLAPIAQAARLLHLPIVFVSVEASLAPPIQQWWCRSPDLRSTALPVLPLHLALRLPWERL
jgi:hypothetical protein